MNHLQFDWPGRDHRVAARRREGPRGGPSGLRSGLPGVRLPWAVWVSAPIRGARPRD